MKENDMLDLRAIHNVLIRSGWARVVRHHYQGRGYDYETIKQMLKRDTNNMAQKIAEENQRLWDESKDANS